MRGRRRSGAGKELRAFVVVMGFILLVFWLWRNVAIEGFLTQPFADALASSQP